MLFESISINITKPIPYLSSLSACCIVIYATYDSDHPSLNNHNLLLGYSLRRLGIGMRSSPKKIAMSLQARENTSPRRVAATPEEFSIEEGSWKEEEVCSPLKADSIQKHRPLTPFRAVRGVLCLVVFLSTALTILVCFAPVVAVLLRLFSIHYSRKATSFLFGRWLALWPFLFEKINGTKVVFSGDTVPHRECILIIANHKTEVDWMYLWDLALRKGSIGYVKYVLKSSLMKLPVFGWGFHILEFIPLKRKWEVDEPILRKMLLSFSDPRDPLWLSIFPEGTDYDEEKCKKSQTFAAENGLPVLSHVLLPRTKGFCACLEALRDSFDAVYDLTIAYKNQLPSFMDNAFGVDPSEVHIHVRRIPMSDIPESSTDAASWLVDTFHIKDKMLSVFQTQGHFPDEGGEEDISTLQGLVNLMLILVLTAIIIYLTIFSSVWFKIYMGFSCVYLASATFFEIKPVPVLDFVKAFRLE